MKKLLKIITVISVALFISGCAGSYTYVPVQQSETKYFTVNLEPTANSMVGYKALNLTVNNKTNKDLEIDWNRTLFIKDGRTYGTFMFEGVRYLDRNSPKAPDLVFANGSFTKTIYPNNLVSFSKNWYHGPMGLGRVGVLLSVKVDGKEVTRKIYVDIQEKSK